MWTYVTWFICLCVCLLSSGSSQLCFIWLQGIGNSSVCGRERCRRSCPAKAWTVSTLYTPFCPPPHSHSLLLLLSLWFFWSSGSGRRSRAGKKKYKKHVCSQNGAVKNDIKAVEANFRESEKCLLEKKSHSENSWDTAVTNVFRNSNLQGRFFILCNKNRIENTSENLQLLFIIVVSLTGCVCVSAWCSHTCRDILKTTLLWGLKLGQGTCPTVRVFFPSVSIRRTQ